MQVKTVVERVDPEDGEVKTYEFTAVLNEQQHAYLIQFAIATLMTKGIIPFNLEGDIEVPEKEHLN